MTKIKLFYIISIFILSLTTLAYSETCVVEKSKLTDEEIKTLKKIQTYYPDFHFTNNVSRFYSIDPKTKFKKPIKVEIIFEKKENLYFGEYISYNVEFQPRSTIINYSFDAGTAFRGEGTFVVFDEKIINTEWSCGVTSCGIYVSENGREIYHK